MGARLYAVILALSTDSRRGVDGMKLIQHIAGVMVETALVFDNPDEALFTSLGRLQLSLNDTGVTGPLPAHILPPSNIIDLETERGRHAARMFFEEWMDCAFEFDVLFNAIVHNAIMGWEEAGQPRAESLRLLIECATKAMGYEIAAQELCDLAIDEKIGRCGWTIADCMAALSAVAGRRLALSLSTDSCMVFRGPDIPENLDHIVHVMTQEAVRLGVPAGGSWRFGLPANDMPLNAPYDLIQGIEPYCKSFFRAIRMNDLGDQAVACAKAAGRMIAVAAGGASPDIEPAIAKPLAMAAITETYKSVCMMHEAMEYTT